MKEDSTRAPRGRTGTLYPRRLADGSIRYSARLRLADGSKSKRIPLPAGVSESKAREIMAGLQAVEDVDDKIYKDTLAKRRTAAAKVHIQCEGETADAWFQRFADSRRGVLDGVDLDCMRWRRWASHHIGPKAMVSVTTADIEAIRDELDAAIVSKALRPKTALNTWSVVRTAFRHAARSKRKDLQVRPGDDPTVGVLPPERGSQMIKPWMYPKEVIQLLQCEGIDIHMRRLHAIACYLFLRPGELMALQWSDLDLDAAIISISRAWAFRTKKPKPPKTHDGNRRFPIPATLLPLLRAMSIGKAPDQLVVPVMLEVTSDLLGRITRKHLLSAGLNDQRLHQRTHSHLPFVFRSWRDTGITWLAVQGLDVSKIGSRAGHSRKGITTTLNYIKAAEDLSGGAIGEPFPPLPECLFEGLWATDWATESEKDAQGLVTIEASQCERRDLNPQNKAISTKVRGVGEDTTPDEPLLSPRNVIAVDQSLGHNGITSETACGAPKASEARSVEECLSLALSEAATAGRWDVVAQLAKELEARRLAGSNVIVLGVTNAK